MIFFRVNLLKRYCTETAPVYQVKFMSNILNKICIQEKQKPHFHKYVATEYLFQIIPTYIWQCHFHIWICIPSWNNYSLASRSHRFGSYFPWLPNLLQINFPLCDNYSWYFELIYFYQEVDPGSLMTLWVTSKYSHL